MAHRRLALAAALGVASTALALSPRPSPDAAASYARWLVHESDYGTVFTHHNGRDIFGNIISSCDGQGNDESTGIVYTYLPDLDATAHDLAADTRVSVTFTEKALAGNACNATAQDPSCGTVTMSGTLAKVPAANASAAEQWFKKCHPQGYIWGVTHSFKPYWMDPSFIELISVTGPGGVVQPSVAEYLRAPWHGAPAPAPAPAPTPSLNPRPWIWQHPEMARWLVHESDFAAIGTHDGSEALGDIMSISDGNGYGDSTGIIYALLAPGSATYKDLVADSRASVTLSEKALGGGNAPGCLFGTAESPPCVRLTIQGRMTPVPEANRSQALRNLLARHPAMGSWGEMVPFWLAPQDITEFFLIPFYGGAEHFTVEAYVKAAWYSGGPSPAPMPLPRPSEDKMACTVCGHVFDAAADADGTAFEDLPDTWKCPVCGQPKSAYSKIVTETGAVAWAHEMTQLQV